MRTGEMILNRFKPCSCGCKGQDPWHKASYRRQVILTPNYLVGYVMLPFSTKPVKVERDSFYGPTTGRLCFGAWVVDRDSIIFDKS